MNSISSCDSLSSPLKPIILSVGLSAADFVAQVDHFPFPDEKMRSETLDIQGGGNAANTACAIGRLSRYADVDLLTAVGDDANGKIIREGIAANAVNVISETYESSSPFTYILCTDIDGENTRTCIHQPSAGDMTVDFVENNIPTRRLHGSSL